MKKAILLIFCLILISCEKDPIDEGVVTNIQGNVYDYANSLPFENLKLKVAEYRTHPTFISASYEFIQWIDSTYTDQNGNYNLDFETSGQGDHYMLHVEEDVDIWTYQYNAIEIDSIGMNNYQDLDFLHIYPTNLIIEINDIDFLPIEIDVDLFPDLESINTNNGTTERLLYSSQFEETEINFRRKNADNEYETYQIIIPASNPTELLDFNITLNNSDFN
jgi:hypothetical protein